MKYIGVIGSRGYEDYEHFKKHLLYLISNIKEDITWVSGGCKSGGDALIKRYCEEENKPLIEHLPDWETHGKSAGFIRNKLIIDDSDYLICYWDGVSKGTASSIKLVQQKGIPIRIVKYE